MRTRIAQARVRAGILVLTALSVATVTAAQRTQWQPPTDSSTEASPIKAAPRAPVVDASAQASPVTPITSGGVSIPPHTAVSVRLSQSIDSGHLKNGDTVHATLTAPVALSPRGVVTAGTPVLLTVVETLPAGRIYAAGEFSLQVLRIGSVSPYTNTLTFRGKPGHKDLPDSAPAVGTDAGLAAGAALTFHVLPPPSAIAGPPPSGRKTPGSVDGIASGGPPPGSSPRKGNGGNAKQTKGATAREVEPADNTFAPAQALGKSSVAPNQPSSPQSAAPANSTQPH